MEFIDKNKNMLILIVIASFIGVGFYYYTKTDDSPSSVPVVESDPPEPITDNSQFTEPEDVEQPAPEEPQKTPAQSVAVIETPAVYTSFGHSPDRPLPIGQATSTSCTTDSNVECYLVFTSGEQEITFDPKTTDVDGGAVWSWTGGTEVTTGTWKVTAIAGDKTSNEETIYVE